MSQVNNKSLDAAFSRWTQESSTPATTIEVSTADGATRQVAALKVSSDRICPYCKNKMQPVTAGGADCFVCYADRHVAPAKIED